jgi:hypothetical protein
MEIAAPRGSFKSDTGAGTDAGKYAASILPCKHKYGACSIIQVNSPDPMYWLSILFVPVKHVILIPSRASYG